MPILFIQKNFFVIINSVLSDQHCRFFKNIRGHF